MAPEPPAAVPNSGGVASAVSAAQTQTLQHFAEIVVEHVPDRLAQVARTILLSGMITSQQEGGALVLRTQVGDLIIRSQIPLPMDRVLTLQIPPGAPPVRAQVLLMPSAQQPLLAPASPSPVGVGVIASAHSPRQAAPAAPITSALPLPQMAQTLSLQAITEVPLQPGLLLPAKVMALPTAPVISPLPLSSEPQTQPSQQTREGQPAPLPSASPVPTSTPTPTTVPVVLPKGLAVPPELMQGLSTQTLRSVLPQNLTDVIAKLPPAVMVPQMRSAPPASPVVSPLMMPQMPMLPAAPQVSSQPAFALLPSLLTLPPGAQVMVQIEKVLPPLLPNEVVSPTPPQSQSQEIPILPAQKQHLPLTPVADKTLPAPVSLEAIVVANTAQGEPVATSPAGLLILESRAPLPEGTRLVLNLVHVSEPIAPDESPLPALPKDWPVMQQIITALTQSNALLPTPVAKPENAGVTILFLLAALRFGKAEDLVGEEAATTLRQSARGVDLLRQLEGEMRQTSQSWNKPPEALSQGEWRTLTVPLPPDAQLSRLAVHLRHEREAEAESGSSVPVKHLVLEVEMSRLGPLLLDGYIRKSRFDLTLRSQRRLPQSLLSELRQAYNDTLAITGWHGEIAFQTAAELWLKS